MGNHESRDEEWVGWIEEAQERISGIVVKTPVALISDEPNRFGPAQVYVKLETCKNPVPSNCAEPPTRS